MLFILRLYEFRLSESNANAAEPRARTYILIGHR